MPKPLPRYVCHSLQLVFIPLSPSSFVETVLEICIHQHPRVRGRAKGRVRKEARATNGPLTAGPSTTIYIKTTISLVSLLVSSVGLPPPSRCPPSARGLPPAAPFAGSHSGGVVGGGEGGSPPEKLNIKSPPDGIPGFDSEMLYQWMLDVYSCWLARSCCPMARIDNAQQERSSRPARLAGQPRPRCLGVWLVESESQVRFCQLANSKRRKSAP